ncbi:MAG: hypothetical protein WA133_05700 [Syntrophales bacterium]
MPKKAVNKNMTILVLLVCVFILTVFIMGTAHAEGIIYDKNKRLLTVQTDTTSFMAILHDVEAKTGIKMTIGGGVPDKYVTLNVEQLPISQIDDLLGELPLSNTAMVYDQKGNIAEIIILPEGKTAAQVYRGRRRGRR